MGLTAEIVGTIVAASDPSRIGAEADYAMLGDTIEYSVSLSIPSTACPVDNIGFDDTLLAEAVLPNLTVVALNGGSPIDLCIPGGPAYTEIISPTYVIAEADYGNNGAPANAVRSVVDAAGIARRESVNDLAAAGAEYTTFVINPCVEVVKTPWCVRDGVPIEGPAYSKVGDEIVWQFVITNCGSDALEFVEIIDALLGDVTVPESCGTLAAPLLPGEMCMFLSEPYLVTEPGTVTNEVEVTFNVLLSGPVGFQRIVISEPGAPEEYLTTDDSDSSSVELVNPDFTVECETVGPGDPGFVNFLVTLTNTGDVDLNIDTDCIGGGLLPVGESRQETVPVPLDPSGVCQDGGSASFSCQATGTLPAEYCLENVLERATDLCTYEAEPCIPGWTLEKECLTSPWNDGEGPCDLEPGDLALYEITVTNTGTCDLDFFVEDAQLGIAELVELGPDGSTVIGGSEIVPDECPTPVEGSPMTENTVTATAFCDAETPGEGIELDTKTASATCCYSCCDPDFEVVKNCLTNDCNDLAPGDDAQYEIVITNTGNCDGLVFIVDDPGATPPSQGAGPLAAGESATLTVTIPVPPCEPDAPECNELVNVVSVTGLLDGYEETKTATAVCEYKCLPPEGCTPGFWKNHTDCWCDAYDPADLVSDVWDRLKSPPYDTEDDGDRKSDFDTDTLEDSIRYRGGSGLAGAARNMLRHATAALLNSCSGDVGYPLSVDFIIEQGNIALDSEDPAVIQDLHTILAGLNEDSPCPIDAHCIRHEDGYDD